MSAAAIWARVAPPLGRRAAIALSLWLAAAGLVLAQFLLLRSLPWPDRGLAAELIPSPEWRLMGTLTPLLLAGAALMLQRRLEDAWGTLASFGLVAFVPFAALSLLIAGFAGPSVLATVRLPDGGSVMLTLDEGMTDIGFVLFEQGDQGGLVWRRVAVLAFVDGGPFDAQPEMVLAPDGRWLLVRRAGIWTDVLRLIDGHPVPIDVPLIGNLRLPDDAAFWRLRSQRIAALTGLRP